jgi:hypothetical protein
VTITAFSYFHVSNRYTLSAMFDKDLGDPEWLGERRSHAQDVIVTWLTTPDAVRGTTKMPSPKRASARAKDASLA